MFDHSYGNSEPLTWFGSRFPGTDLVWLQVSRDQSAVYRAPACGQRAVAVVTLGRRVRVVLRVTPACGRRVRRGQTGQRPAGSTTQLAQWERFGTFQRGGGYLTINRRTDYNIKFHKTNVTAYLGIPFVLRNQLQIITNFIAQCWLSASSSLTHFRYK